jgi:hypothetical protein
MARNGLCGNIHFSELAICAVAALALTSSAGAQHSGASTAHAVAHPPGSPNQPRQVWSELIVYPKNGQSRYQQITDRYECYRWAVLQLGYDPTSAGGETVRGDLTDYNRAQTACLEGRGYSVK